MERGMTTRRSASRARAGGDTVDNIASDTELSTNAATGVWAETYDIPTASGYYQITNTAAGFTSAYPATSEAIFLVTTNTPYWVA